MMYQRFSDRMAYSEGHFIDLPNRSRFVSLRYSLLELQDNLKVLSRKLGLKATKAFLAVLGNPMNNFCTEYQVDGEGVYRCSFSLKDFKRVRDYSRRKYFAVTVASVTIIAIMFSFIFPGQPIGRAASYFWTQTDWSGGPDSLYPNHAANQTNWAKYSSKDANVATGYAADGGTAGQAKLSAQSGSYTETSDTDFNETNLVGEWAMDEGTGSYANDTSGNGNTGTHYGESLSFDGVNDYINTSNEANFDFERTSPFSFEAWIKSSTLNTHKLIFAKMPPGGSQGYYFEINSTNQLFLSESDGAGIQVRSARSTNSVTNILDNRWHQVVVTSNGIDANGIAMYIDGNSIPVTVIQNSLTSNSILNNSIPWIGALQGNLWFFNGSIDEVRVYNRTLSPTEVSEHYQGVFSNNTNLKGLWHFKEGTGQTVADDSGLANNGTLGADATVASDDPAWQTDAPAMWNTSGKFGGSLNFDGLNDYVLANDAFYSNTLTVSAWIKPNASSISAAAKAIISKRRSGEEWALGLNLGRPQFYAFNSVPAVIFSAIGNTTLTAGNWYHITGTYDGTTANIYINGVADTTPVTAPGTIADTIATIEIGSVNLNSLRFFDGLIDEARIYNTALTQSQIQAVMANAKGKGNTITSGTGSGGKIVMCDRNICNSLSNANGASWRYRRSITISGSTFTQLNYQVPVTLTSTLGTPSYANIKADGSDIRFTNSSGAELPYWIKTWNNGGTSTIWVNVDSIPSSPSSATIYMYYGNSLATFATDCVINTNAKANCGINTFVLFDDFSSGNLNYWTQYGGVAPTISTDWSSSADLYSAKVDLSYWNGDSGIKKTINVTNVRIVADAKITAQTGGTTDGLFANNSGWILQSVGQIIDWESNTITAAAPHDIVLRVGFVNIGAAVTGYFDRIRVRKYVSPEPSFSGLGTEQINYFSSGAFTSQIKDLGTKVSSWGTLNWTDTIPVGTSITMKVRSCGDASCSTATAFSSCTNISKGANLSTGGCVTAGHQYLQYQATLNAPSDGSQTPTFSDITVGFNYYPFSYDTVTGALSAWQYRRPITVIAQSATPAGYQVLVTLTTSTLGNPYSNIKTDGGDIRFANSDGTTLLDYWIESWSNTENSKIWVKIPEAISAGASKIIYLYYGNPSATSVSNIGNVLEFFDDFNGAAGSVPDASKWTVYKHYLGVIQLDGSGRLQIASVDSPSGYGEVGYSNVYSNSDIGDNVLMEFKWQMGTQWEWYPYLVGYIQAAGMPTGNAVPSNSYFAMLSYGNLPNQNPNAAKNSSTNARYGGLDTNSSVYNFITDTTTVWVRVAASGATVRTWISFDGSAWELAGNVTAANDLPTGRVGFFNTTYGDRQNDNRIEYVRVRKYASSEPTINISSAPYTPGGTLTSSPYNTQDSGVAVNQISWTETAPSGANVRFQIRTAPNASDAPGSYSEWMGPDGTAAAYFDDTSSGCSKVSTTVTCSIPNTIAIGDGINDQWLQYKAWLESDGAINPVLTGVSLKYVSNGPPCVGANPSTAAACEASKFSSPLSQAADGAITITDYPLADAEEATEDGLVNVQFFYDFNLSNSGVIGSGQYSVALNDASILPSSGYIMIDNEVLRYSSKSGNTLTITPSTGRGSWPGATGTNATATATVLAGAVSTVTVTNPGANYAYPPIVAFSGGGGSGATATADIAGGAVTAINIKNSGSGYTSAPAIALTNYSTRAVSHANSQKVWLYANSATNKGNKANISSAAQTYTSVLTPVSDLSTNGGAYAAAKVRLAANDGNVANQVGLDDLTVTTGIDAKKPAYSSPALKIDANATGDKLININVTEASTLSVRYANASSIPGAGATATAGIADGSVVSFAITNPGANYASAPLISITGGGGTGATAQVTVSGGQVTAITVINGGANYATPPAVTLISMSCGAFSIYEPLSGSTKAWTLNPDASGVSTVCFQAKDNYSNEQAVAFASTPQRISGVQIGDVSVPPKNQYKLLVWWNAIADPVNNDPANIFAKYHAWRSDDAGATYTDITDNLITRGKIIFNDAAYTLNSSAYNYFTDDNNGNSLNASATYYYKVTAEALKGVSAYGTPLGAAADYPVVGTPGPGGGTAADPVIAYNSATGIANITSSSAAFTWQAATTDNKPSDSFVLYTPDAEYASNYLYSQGIPSLINSGLDHTATLQGLASGVTYHYRIRSCGAQGNCGVTSTDYTFTTKSDTIPPIDTSLTSSNITSSSVTLAWLVPGDDGAIGTAASYDLRYTVNASVRDNKSAFDAYWDNPATIQVSDEPKPIAAGAGITQSMTVANLTPGTTYYFALKTADDVNLVSLISNVLQVDIPVQADTIAPAITVTPGGAAVTANSATISWTTDKDSSSLVDYGTDANFIYAATQGNQTEATKIHTVALSGLTPATTYYYRVKSIDKAGNIGQKPVSSDAALVKASYSFTTAAASAGTIPSISSVATTMLTATSFRITWNTDVDADSAVGYSTDISYSLVAGSPAPTRNHSVTLSNLAPSTAYNLQINSRNNDQAAAPSFATLTTGAGLDLAPPIFALDPAITNLSGTGATVTWSTIEKANSFVDFGTVAGLYSSTQGSASDSTLAHTVVLSSLTPLTAYYFQVRSADASGNVSIASNSGAGFTFTTTSGSAVQCPASGGGGGSSCQICSTCAVSDTAAPVITNIAVSETTFNSATITWNTDEDSDSAVEYGQTSYTVKQKYDSSSSNRDLAKSHSVILTGLDSSTTYYFRVSSADAKGNVAKGSELSFKTLAISEITDKDKKAAEQMKKEFEDLAKTLIKENLTSEEDIKEIVSRLKNPPRIGGEGPEVKNIKSYGATISWQTDRKANSIVKFKANSAASSVVAVDSTWEQRGRIDEFDIAHAIDLLGLAPSTHYSFQVESQDVLGNSSSSPIKEFTTAAASSIFAVQVTDLALNSAVISWETANPSSSIVEYGLSSDYGQTRDKGAESATSHALPLADLLQGTTYHFRARSVEANGQILASDDYTFTTYQMPEITEYALGDVKDDSIEIKWASNIPINSAIRYTDKETKEAKIEGQPDFLTAHALTLNNLEPGKAYLLEIQGQDKNGNQAVLAPFEVQTGLDTVPPEISQVRSQAAILSGSEDRVQAIVSWRTNELATTRLFWDSGSTRGDKFANETKPDENLTTNHILVITQFKPGTVYRFRAVSRDKFGNNTVSQDFSILTPVKRQSVIQMIMVKFEDIFGWMNRLRR